MGNDKLDEALSSIDINTETAKETVESFNDNTKEQIKLEKEIVPQPIVTHLTLENRSVASQKQIVPKDYAAAQFDEERIKQNLKLQYAKEKGLYKVYNFNSYVAVCNDILTTCRMGMLPDRSYLIGAPQRFGKQSFVTECLITLDSVGFNVVPYISLWELAQIRVDNEKKNMNPYKKYKEKDKATDYYYTDPLRYNVDTVREIGQVKHKFTFMEYVNAECLFVHFTDVVSKDIESHTLYQVLSMRSAKALPTIVMISTSLEPYINDTALRETVWNYILEINDNDSGYDRLHYTSCYRLKNLNNITAEDGTGIVSDRNDNKKA